MARFGLNLAPIGAKLRQRAFWNICKFRFFDAAKHFSEKNSDFFFRFFIIFGRFSNHFRGARLFLTSKSNSSWFFALDGQIFRSVPWSSFLDFSPSVHRPVARSTARNKGGKARPLRGQGTGVVGGKARTSFQKICPKKRFWKRIWRFYVQIDLNCTSRSISIWRPDRSQLYV